MTITLDTDILKTIDLFSDVPEQLLKKICGICHLENYGAGHVLIEQGRQLDTIYMVADGELSLTSRLANGQEIFIEKMNQGKSIGISALFKNAVAEFSVTCVQNSTLITISAEDAVKMFADDYHTGLAVMLLVVERFRRDEEGRTQQFLRSLRNYPEIYSAMS